MLRSADRRPRALVIYPEEDGASRRAAQEIARGLSLAGDVNPTVASLEGLPPERLAGADLLVLGAPASARGAAAELRRLTESLPGGVLARKMVSLFEAGGAASSGNGVLSLRRSLVAGVPGLHLVAPGISIVTDRSHGELPETELARCRQFGEHLAGLAVAALPTR